jgi:ribosomal protein L16 Arg81 hydroxylase
MVNHGESGLAHTESYQDHEMTRGQEVVGKTLDKIRAWIVKKTAQSDQLIEQLGEQLAENRAKLQIFKDQLSSLDVRDIQL